MFVNGKVNSTFDDLSAEIEAKIAEYDEGEAKQQQLRGEIEALRAQILSWANSNAEKISARFGVGGGANISGPQTITPTPPAS